MNISKDEILEKSILVVAHPDDEILWFSSILDKVDRVLICFLECESNPRWTIGRKKSLTEYPLSNVSCLRVKEAGVFSDNNFREPRIRKYGLQITDKRLSDKKYIENFFELKKHLKNSLSDYRNVFTHNPWGEYGNEEHIQLYSVVRDLKEKLNFDLWFSNYTSNKSFEIMLKYISNAVSGYVTFKTNKTLSDHIKGIYKKNDCWTWYDDWKWFDEESFIKDNQLENKTSNYGHMFPLNMINVGISSEPAGKPDRRSNILRRFAPKRKGGQFKN